MSCWSRGFLLFCLLLVLTPNLEQACTAPVVSGPVYVRTGEPVSLQCSTDGAPGNLTWKKDGGPLPAGADVSLSPNVSIDSASPSLHSGNYTCSIICVANDSSTVTVESEPFHLLVYFLQGTLSVCGVYENGAIVNGITSEFNGNTLEYSVGAGSQVKLTCCPPFGAPAVTVRWTRFNANITGGSYQDMMRTLVLNDVDINDRGDYRCAYDHVLGSNVSERIQLKIVDPASTEATPVTVVILPVRICTKIGSTVNIPCTVSGSLRANGISWRIGQDTLVTDGPKYTLHTNNSLTVSNVSAADEKTYRCQALGEDGVTHSDTVELTTFCITSVTITPPTLITGINTNQTLTCSSTYRNIATPTFIWTTPNGSTIQGSALKLTNVQFSDAGTYLCTANSPNSRPNTGQAIVTVEGYPRISVTAFPIKAQLYHPLTLTCWTNSSLSGQEFVWKSNGTVLSAETHPGVSISSARDHSTLTIASFSSSNVSMYTCTLLNSRHVPVVGAVNVTLSEEIYLRADFGNQSGTRGYRLSVSCHFLGGDGGDITVRWYRGDTLLPGPFQNMSVKMDSTGVSMLIIDNLTLSHEDVYSCNATDGSSHSFNKSFFIIVNIPGQFIQLPEPTVTMQEGQFAQVDCIVSGKPLPKVMWIKDGTLISLTSSGRVSAHNNGSLIFNNLVMSDDSSYICFFLEGPAHDSHTVSLRVVPLEATPTSGTQSTILGVDQNIFIFIIIAAVGCIFVFLIILLMCLLFCYIKCYQKRSSTNLPKAVLETSFERRPSLRNSSLRGSLRKDNSGILQQSPSNVSSLWTFATDNTKSQTTIPMTVVSSSIAVSPGPPVPSPIPPPDGPTASLATELQLAPDVPTFPRQNLILSNDVMGEGEFGPVFRGIARHITEEENETLVAVKVLVSREGEEALWPSLMDFVSQMKLSSPFVARILGLCVDGEPFYVIYQYLDRGDLKRFLTDSRPSPLYQPLLTQLDLLHIVSQISDGMLYLYRQQIIHGDLATRNCLVGSDLSVKIADLGIGHDLYEEDYYDNGSQLLPIRWMAPELLRDSESGSGFSLASDIWSFGIFCWEVFAYAQRPYEELSDVQVLRLVPEGHVLSPPEEGMPPLLYSLLMDCWQGDPMVRPLFTEIATAVRSIDID